MKRALCLACILVFPVVFFGCINPSARGWAGKVSDFPHTAQVMKLMREADSLPIPLPKVYQDSLLATLGGPVKSQFTDAELEEQVMVSLYRSPISAAPGLYFFRNSIDGKGTAFVAFDQAGRLAVGGSGAPSATPSPFPSSRSLRNDNPKLLAKQPAYNQSNAVIRDGRLYDPLERFSMPAPVPVPEGQGAIQGVLENGNSTLTFLDASGTFLRLDVLPMSLLPPDDEAWSQLFADTQAYHLGFIRFVDAQAKVVHEEIRGTGKGTEHFFVVAFNLRGKTVQRGGLMFVRNRVLYTIWDQQPPAPASGFSPLREEVGRRMNAMEFSK